MLSICFAVEKFHYFIYHKEIKIVNDHKPLIGIFKKEVGKIVSPRLQRMRLKLLKYKFTFEYTPGKNLHIADALSRSYLKEKVNDNLEYNEVVHIVEKHLNITLNKKQQFQEATIKDKDLSLLTTYVKTSWPNYNKIPNALKVYSQYKN